jgi:putative aldouronate transport system permease protein
MIFLRKRELFPLQLILREILISNDTNSMSPNTSTGDQEEISETIKYAVIMVVTVPILVLYPFLQKYFVKGALVGAIKG